MRFKAFFSCGRMLKFFLGHEGIIFSQGNLCPPLSQREEYPTVHRISSVIGAGGSYYCVHQGKLHCAPNLSGDSIDLSDLKTL